MSELVFHSEGVLRRLQTMSDGGVRVIFDTQELSPANAAALHMFVHQYCGIGLAARSEKPVSVNAPEIVLEEQEKSPSTRLRSVLFLLWKERGSEGDFDSYYRKTMNNLIDQFKSKLPAQ